MLNIPLADSTFKDLRDYIYDKSGIYITDTKKYLVENRLSRILQEKKLGSFEDYLKIIKVATNGKELSRLYDAVTTNETYFFREPDQFNVLMNEVLPKVLSQKKGSKTLKIWSAACSTGEEAYTIAMFLMEKHLSTQQFEIYASDISDAVLHSANEAIYNSYSTRNIPEPFLKKYFTNSGQSYTLNSKVRDYVKFTNLNLLNDAKLKSFRGMDIIFCRNVLIYFDTKAKQKVVSNLYDNLNPGGYLFIGSSESLHNVTRALRPNVINKVITYQKV